MYLDNEKNILEQICNDLSPESVLLYNGNSFSKKIYQCLQQVDKMQSDFGHDAEPPDFYSDDLDIMFDVARLNDSEIKKSYNPTFIAERKMQQEVEQSWIAQELSNVSDKLLCIDKDWASDEVHNMNHYLKNMKRVIGDHLSSNGHPNKIKDIWMKKHPNISRKGLLMYDETENYFQGQCLPYSSGQWLFITNTPKVIFYLPWMDKNIMEPIYQSDCDFVIWCMPYKWCGNTLKWDKKFPHTVILDTRFQRTDYFDYDYPSFTRS